MGLFHRFSTRLLLAVLSTAAAGWGAANAPPNVVVITIDTLRADHVGCYGYKQIHTPNIDALAADGVRFEHAFTPVPITLPAHTVIFTTRYQPTPGMTQTRSREMPRSRAWSISAAC